MDRYLAIHDAFGLQFDAHAATAAQTDDAIQQLMARAYYLAVANLTTTRKEPFDASVRELTDHTKAVVLKMFGERKQARTRAGSAFVVWLAHPTRAPRAVLDAFAYEALREENTPWDFDRLRDAVTLVAELVYNALTNTLVGSRFDAQVLSNGFLRHVVGEAGAALVRDEIDAGQIQTILASVNSP